MDRIGLRCRGKQHALLLDSGRILEIKCDSRLCGAGPGIVVLHRWDMANGGAPLPTRKYRDPARNGR